MRGRVRSARGRVRCTLEPCARRSCARARAAGCACRARPAGHAQFRRTRLPRPRRLAGWTLAPRNPRRTRRMVVGCGRSLVLLPATDGWAACLCVRREAIDNSAGPDEPPVAAGYAPPPDAYAPPPPPPPDPAASAVGGAIVGGLLGGLITGRPAGAAAGAIVGGTTGAIVGAQATQRPGYYLSQGGCYYRYPSGQYVAVDPRSCY